ncbi:IclR family transcriptional regulator C-terminal domain-containing protein [Aquisalimonas lutea]|uniref:IclR family transcriptional regulator n=1 Tax=Aquisalimonas lutea TaxID=1327750 RepID=UPI0025B5E995|nr:IclR family transcriptional regulator C-terminal domain-containing protein [Aquisalimonas lutea]MDN3517554.1 IclR family transcriptional regulator C-terminal domain-containing protein [Aquisalimonas lutea]
MADNTSSAAFKTEQPPSGTLARGLAILRTVLDAAQPLALADIAAATQLDLSTTHRLARTLEDNGYLVRIGSSKRYAASPQALEPLPVMHPIQQLRREARSIIEGLASRLRETVVLVLYLDTERMVVDIAQSQGSLAPYYNTWLNGPLHGSGSGKALLLSLSPKERNELLGKEPYPAVTPYTLTSHEALEADLAASKARGFVSTRDEHYVGLSAVAANVPTWHGKSTGCLVVTGHTRDLDAERIASVGEELARVSGLMLYQAPSLKAAAQSLGNW